MISKERLAGMIDHTILHPSVSTVAVVNACRQAVQHGFATIVVNPAHVAIAVEAVQDSHVKVCSVLSFPFGLSTPEAKAYEAKCALALGSQELDMVMNFGALRSGNMNLVSKDIRSVVDVAKRSKKVIVKVILENCYLSNEQKKMGCRLAVEAGADYVKTSTGFGPGGATVDDVQLMKAAVGTKCGVKAAGGIRTLHQTLAMIEAGATRIGTSSGVQILEGLGRCKNAT